MRVVYLLVVVSGLLLGSEARAELVERDWLAPGDGLLTYDPVNGREWLDFPVSRLSQFGGTELEGNTLANAVTLAKQELLPGGLFEGFTLAVREDVIGLVDAAGVDLATRQARRDSADQMAQLIELLGQNNALGIVGVLDELNPDFDGVGSAQPYFAAFLGVGGSIFNLEAFFDITPNPEFFMPNASSLSLYRQAIPEPTTCCLMTSAFLTTLLQRPTLGAI